MQNWPTPRRRKPLVISPKEKGNLWLGFACLFFLLAAGAYLVPAEAAAGRWSRLHNAVTMVFGTWSEIALFLALGVTALVVAVLNYRADPCDHSRWPMSTA